MLPARALWVSMEDTQDAKGMDILYVPGGLGVYAAQHDPQILDFIRNHPANPSYLHLPPPKFTRRTDAATPIALIVPVFGPGLPFALAREMLAEGFVS